MAGNEPFGKMDSVLRSYFLGIWIFAKPRLTFCGAGRKRGLGKMNSRPALVDFQKLFSESETLAKKLKLMYYKN